MTNSLPLIIKSVRIAELSFLLNLEGSSVTPPNSKCIKYFFTRLNEELEIYEGRPKPTELDEFFWS